MQPVLAQLMVRGLNDARPRFAQRRLAIVLAPRPGVAEPQRRQDAQPGRFRPAIVHGDPDEHVFRALLGVFDEHVEVAVVVEDAGVEQLVLELLPRSSPVRLDQVPVGKLALRVLVEVLHVRVRRRAVEVEVVLLHVLAVVALAVGEPEQALLQDRVALVPQRQRKAQPLLVVAESAEPVLAPPVGARARLVVGEVVPGVAVFAVVLADRAPLPLAEVGSPFLPRHAGARFRKARAFRHRFAHDDSSPVASRRSVRDAVGPHDGVGEPLERRAVAPADRQARRTTRSSCARRPDRARFEEPHAVRRAQSLPAPAPAAACAPRARRWRRWPPRAARRDSPRASLTSAPCTAARRLAAACTTTSMRSTMLRSACIVRELEIAARIEEDVDGRRDRAAAAVPEHDDELAGVSAR